MGFGGWVGAMVQQVDHMISRDFQFLTEGRPALCNGSKVNNPATTHEAVSGCYKQHVMMMILIMA